jgi:hypothetical protein
VLVKELQALSLDVELLTGSSPQATASAAQKEGAKKKAVSKA